MPDPTSSYRDDLGRVLRSREVAALRRFLLSSAEEFGDRRQVDEVSALADGELRERMHRMIIARPDLADLHRESRERLFKLGVDAFGPGGARRN